MQRLLVIVCLCMSFIVSGCNSSSNNKPVKISSEISEYVLVKDQVSSCAAGAVILDGQVKYFDAPTEQIVALCTRTECTHKYNPLSGKNDCPASQLGKMANMGIAALYDGKIWVIHSEGENWEFWTSDTNGENLKKEFAIAMNTKSSYSWCHMLSIFSNGCFYTVEECEEISENGGVYVKYRLIAIDLESEELIVLSDWTTGTDQLELIGVFETSVYYRVRTIGMDRVYRVSMIDHSRELILEENQIWAFIENGWFAFAMERDSEYAIYLENLKTNETKEIDKETVTAVRSFLMCDEKIVWGDYHAEAGTHEFYIHSIKDNETRKTATYESDGDSLVFIIDDVWLFQNGALNSYKSICEEKLQTGDKKTRFD